jgi:hypothetical protein
MRPSVHFRIVAEARESEDMVSGQEQLLMAYAQADIGFRWPASVLRIARPRMHSFCSEAPLVACCRERHPELHFRWR